MFTYYSDSFHYGPKNFGSPRVKDSFIMKKKKSLCMLFGWCTTYLYA